MLCSTPLKLGPHTVVIRDGSTRTSLYHDWAVEHFRDKVVWDVDPARFIAAVWGHQELYQSSKPLLGSTGLGSRSYRLDKEALRARIRESNEARTYKNVSSMLNELLVQLLGAEVNPPRIARSLPAEYMSWNKTHAGSYTDHKVDRGYGVVPTDAVPRLGKDSEAGFLEVKEHVKISFGRPKEASEQSKRKREVEDLEVEGASAAKRLHQLDQEGGGGGSQEQDEDVGLSGAPAVSGDGQSADEVPSPPMLTRHEAMAA